MVEFIDYFQTSKTAVSWIGSILMSVIAPMGNYSICLVYIRVSVCPFVCLSVRLTPHAFRNYWLDFVQILHRYRDYDRVVQCEILLA